MTLTTFSKQELFDGIRLVRPLLILFVCIAHLPGVAGYHSEYDQFDRLNTLLAVFIKDYWVRGAVPILTVISGYLAFRSFRKRPTYLEFIGEKARRLLWPFIVWNMIALLVLVVAYQVTGISIRGIASLDASFYPLLSKLVGLQLQLPINAPTYFIRDLFLIMLLVPMVHCICRYPGVFVLAWVGYAAMLWGPSLFVYQGEEFSAHILFRRDMLLFFSLGYFLSMHNIGIPKISMYGVGLASLSLALVGIGVSMYLSGMTPSGEDYVESRFLFSSLFVLSAPALLSWLVACKDHAVGRLLAFLSPYSFTLFLSHSLSGQAFRFTTSRVLHWRVNEMSAAWEILVYILVYCVWVVVPAILLLNVWRMFRSMMSRSAISQAST